MAILGASGRNLHHHGTQGTHHPGKSGWGKRAGTRGAGAACSPTESPVRTALVGKLLTSDHGRQPPMGSQTPACAFLN